MVLSVLYRQLADLKNQLDAQADHLSDQVDYQLTTSSKEQTLQMNQALNRLQLDLYQELSELKDLLHHHLSQNSDRLDQRFEHLRESLNRSVSQLQQSNENRLEQMRQTVEEKLEATLQSRLQTSFATVSQQLESVNQGLGEMKKVAADVGSLNKVLSNTKTRGILGELQLGQIIEDILVEGQYEREYALISGSANRVEYAIKLPGVDQSTYLPIDSKFPLESYYRLEEAYEAGDKALVEKERQGLLRAVRGFAKDMNTKYLHPPETTHFAILFLPTEGLYSEIVRQAAFFDSLRRDENVIVAGPSTLSALLNSLSVGFRTLTLQKNAHGISQLLADVRFEFDKFGQLLTKAQKQLLTASKTVDSLLTTRTKAIQQALENIELDDRQDKPYFDFTEKKR